MTDYIERQAAMDVFENLADEDWNKNTGTTWANAFIEVAGMIDGIPPADVRPVVRGEWENMGDFIKCSVCKATRLKEFNSYYGKVQRLVVETNFCPNCGADMRGGDAE